MNIFNKIFQLIGKWFWTIWEMADGPLEAYDSIPDKLREKFKLHNHFYIFVVCLFVKYKALHHSRK